MQGSINSIESMGLVDGPGIRTVIFLNGCRLRCRYCHNPEMFNMGTLNITSEELAKKILRNKPYYGNTGGVTFSGGEPLLQKDFLIDCIKKLKKENIHIALDTAGYGTGNYDEIIQLVDLFLLDIKYTTDEGHKDLTGQPIKEQQEFINLLNKYNKEVWIRQVIVPGLIDNKEYLISLAKTVKSINNVTKIEFLPYHKMGIEKYQKLHIPYTLNCDAMDKGKCKKLHEQFLSILKES